MTKNEQLKSLRDDVAALNYEKKRLEIKIDEAANNADKNTMLVEEMFALVAKQIGFTIEKEDYINEELSDYSCRVVKTIKQRMILKPLLAEKVLKKAVKKLSKVAKKK